jgi:hypothetical protein
MKITLEEGDYGTYLLVAEDGRDLLIQTDYDFPAVASNFGWRVEGVLGETECQHASTDGTIDCADCGMRASSFIEDAATFLDEHIGDETSDPGYLDSE